MTEKEKTSASKLMSLALRHAPAKIGITLDNNGWADTAALIEGMKRAGRLITPEQLKEIVETNDKQRFKFNEDFSRIRANQGHSIYVDVELKEVKPPDVLYHGTASRFVGSIKSEGLLPQSRLYVHLSGDAETAVKVGGRHGKPVVLAVDARGMYENGFKFYISDNNVWLTGAVPSEYIREI
jgi:putative RNA 2'-phosphotransferase